jgi:uncharacterized membrane protein YhhN
MPKLDRRDWLVAVAAGFALAYWLGFSLRPLAAGEGWVVAKALSVLPLAAWAWLRREVRGGALLVVALLAHGAGDVLLNVGPLLGAIGAFMFGHLLYFAVFLRLGITFPPKRRWRLALAIGILLYGAIFVAWLQPRVAEGLGGAVMIYSGVILAMAVAAVCCRAAAPWLALGAVLYVASDSVIATNLFVGEVSWAPWFTWPAYWIGQLLIVSAVLFAGQQGSTTPRA